MFTNDLDNNFRTNNELCLYRHCVECDDLEKFILSQESPGNDLYFEQTNTFTLVENQSLKDTFLPIKVQLIGDKEGIEMVKVVDMTEFERYAVEDRPKVSLSI